MLLHSFQQRAASALVTLFVFAVALVPVIAQSATSPKKPAVNITFTSKPNPPKAGDNAFEVVVKDPTGKPVTDAEVSVTFYMAPMPAMKMPEMKNSISLKHVKDGKYAGMGLVMMAGKWEVTVTVKRAGKELDSEKFPVSAQ